MTLEEIKAKIEAIEAKIEVLNAEIDDLKVSGFEILVVEFKASLA